MTQLTYVPQVSFVFELAEEYQSEDREFILDRLRCDDDVKNLFAVMITLPHIFVEYGKATFDDRELELIIGNEELFRDMLEYFVFSPIGKKLADEKMILTLARLG